MKQTERETAISTACMITMVFTSASVPIFLRYFVDYLDPWCVNAVRYSTAAILLFPFVFILSRRATITTGGDCSTTRNIWRSAIIPSMVNIIGQVGWALCPYFGVKAAMMSFGSKLSFLFTTLFGFLLVPTERLLARKTSFWLGAIICIAGITVASIQKIISEGVGSTAGMGILLFTAMMWGAYAVSIRKFLPGFPRRLSFAVVSLYTSIGLVILMLIFGDYAALAKISPKIWLLLTISAIFGIAISHILYYRGIHGLGPIVANGISMVTPFLTYFGALIILGEQLRPVRLIGGIGVITGGVLLVLARTRIEREESQTCIRP